MVLGSRVTRGVRGSYVVRRLRMGMPWVNIELIGL